MYKLTSDRSTSAKLHLLGNVLGIVRHLPKKLLGNSKKVVRQWRTYGNNRENQNSSVMVAGRDYYILPAHSLDNL